MRRLFTKRHILIFAPVALLLKSVRMPAGKQAPLSE